MDTPTTLNSTITFKDIPLSPMTKIILTVNNADGSVSVVPMDVLKPVADTYRSASKATLLAYFNRVSADTVL